MNSYYQDPNLQAALLAQAAYENERQNEAGSEGGGLVDFLGKTALVAGLGVAAGIGGRRLLANRAARGATQKVTVEDLGNIGRKAEADVRSAQQRYQAAPAPSQPPPSQPTSGGMVDRLGKMAETTRQARSERMPGVIQADLSEVSPENARAALKAINDRVLNPRNATAQEGIQSFFQESPSYGQLPKAAQQAAPAVKALPPARTTGTDFLTSQLGGRGYIEQTILDRAAEQAAGDLIDEVAAFNNQSARSELATQAASVRSQQRKNLWNLVSEIQNETLVDQQQTTRTFNVDQAINALDAAEDQQTGRVKQQLQRNEDVDLSRVDFMEDMAEADRQAMIQNADPSEMIGYEADASINQIAAQLPDGRPVDQAEGLDLQTGERFAIRQSSTAFAPRSALGATGLVPGQKILSEQKPQGVANTSAVRFMEAERDKIARELDIDTASITPQGQIRIDTELAKRLGPQASTFGPKYTARAQALQTFANTGNPIAAETIKRFGLSPVTFETFENMPAEKKRLFESAAPMSLEGYPSTELQAAINQTGIKINAPGFGVVDIATLRKPVITESTAKQADEFIEGVKADKLNWLQEKSNEIKGAKQEILLERKERIKTTADNLLVKLEQAKANGQNDVVNELEGQLDNLRTLYKNPELVGDYKEFGEGGIRHLDAQLRGVQRSTNEQIAALEKRYPTTLANRTGEASRVFGVLDVDTGEFIPETMEVRSGRSDVNLGRKGGGGRNIAQYTAGERLDEEIRNLQGGVRMRDYDIETGAPVQRWQGDRTKTESLPTTRQEASRGVIATQKVVPVTTRFKGEPGVGSTVDAYGIRRDLDPAANTALKPSQPIYTENEIADEAVRLAELSSDAPFAEDYELLREQAIKSLGSQQSTPARKTSVDVSSTLRQLQLRGKPGEADAFLTRFKQGLI
jgi:hypothetical protein